MCNEIEKLHTEGMASFMNGGSIRELEEVLFRFAL